MGVNASAEAARLRSLRVMEGPHASAFAAHAHLPSATVSTSATVTVKTAAAAMEETIALIAQEQLAATKSSSTTKHFSLKKPKHSTRFHHQPAGSVRIDEVLDADLLGVCARFLDFASLSACELVNSHWRELLSDPVIWEQLYCDRWRGGRVLTLPPADRRVLLPHFKNVCRQRIANSHVRMCTRARTWMRKSGNVFVHNDSMELRDFGLGCTESIRTEHALRPLASCIDGGDGDGLVNPICYFEATVAGCGSVGLASISSAAERKAYGFGSDNHLGWYPVSYGYHGDDGMFYWNAGRRTPAALGGLHRDFGPRWGDTTPFRVRNANTTTIGCGLLGDNAQREVFFTLNGEFVGVSPVQLEPGREYAAAVSLHQFGDSVELNFGAAAFAFDVEQFAWKKLQALREKALLERDGE
ncbi:Spry domain-containing protein [Globisporangium polare]